MVLNTNGKDYHVLENAARHIKGVPGLTCEVGLREGGGTKYIVDALLSNSDEGRVHIALDPYGKIPYIQSETQVRMDGPYPNEMMSRTLAELYAYVHSKPILLLFFALEDSEFFSRYETGVPVYHKSKKELMNTYALTYLDGPHNLDCTMKETLFFAARSTKGSIIVYDDIHNYYDHSKIKEYLEGLGWKELELASSKVSYIKE